MRNFQRLQQATGRTIRHEDETYLFFGGTAYLGLLADPDFMDLYKDGIDRYGLNNGTSRNNNIQLAIYDEAEQRLAKRFAVDDCLLLSSGYLAAQLCIQSLKDAGELLYAPNAHPALWQAEAPLPSQDFNAWASNTVDYINTSTADAFVIVSNTVDNMTPALYDFSVFSRVSPEKKIYFLLDDSHGIGLAAVNAFFVDTQALAGENREIIVVASLAKGMGTDAGAIFCSKQLAAQFRSSPFFTGSSPSSPAALYALTAGEWIYKRQWQALHNNKTYLDHHLGALLRSIPNFPVFTLDMPDLFTRLLAKNILITSFSYPLPTDLPINRIVVSASHKQDDLGYLIRALQSLC